MGGDDNPMRNALTRKKASETRKEKMKSGEIKHPMFGKIGYWHNKIGPNKNKTQCRDNKGRFIKNG